MSPTNTDDDLHHYTPEVLRDYAHELDATRMRMLCGIDDAGSDPESEQFYLLALASLDQAHRFMKLASIKQSQGIAAHRTRCTP